MSVKLEPMPLSEEIECSQRRRKPGLESGPRPMRDLLQMTVPGQHRQDGFDQHPGMPDATVTELEIARVALFGVEAGVAQDDPLLLKGLKQRMEGGVGGMRSRTIPGHDHPSYLSSRQRLPSTIQRR
jgi:hypothetical protein